MPLFELAMISGREGWLKEVSLAGDRKDVLAMLDTEAKRLQAIEDLYAIVRAQPVYAKLKEPNWKPDTPSIAVVAWLLRKLGRLAKGDRWTMDTYADDAGNSRCCFVIYQEYGSYLIKPRAEFFALDFLPALKKRDQPLHDLIVDLMALVSRRNNIPLWDEDGDFSEFLTALTEDAFCGNLFYQKQYYSYTRGVAAQYLQLLKRRRRSVTIKSVTSMFEAYQANSQRKRELMYWVRKGLELAATGRDLVPNTYVPGYVPRPVTRPDQLYKIIWSEHPKDYLHIKAWQQIDRRDWQMPVKFIVARPGEQIGTLKPDRYPIALYEFMSYGVSLTQYRYKQYFFKDSYSRPETPAERLLEDIDAAEMMQVVREEAEQQIRITI